MSKRSQRKNAHGVKAQKDQLAYPKNQSQRQTFRVRDPQLIYHLRLILADRHETAADFIEPRIGPEVESRFAALRQKLSKWSRAAYISEAKESSPREGGSEPVSFRLRDPSLAYMLRMVLADSGESAADFIEPLIRPDVQRFYAALQEKLQKKARGELPHTPVHPAKIGLDESEWRDDPAALAEWEAWIKTVEPLEYTPAEAAAFAAFDEQMRRYNLEAVRRQMAEGIPE